VAGQERRRAVPDPRTDDVVLEVLDRGHLGLEQVVLVVILHRLLDQTSDQGVLVVDDEVLVEALRQTDDELVVEVTWLEQCDALALEVLEGGFQLFPHSSFRDELSPMPGRGGAALGAALAPGTFLFDLSPLLPVGAVGATWDGLDVLGTFASSAPGRSMPISSALTCTTSAGGADRAGSSIVTGSDVGIWPSSRSWSLL